MVYRRSGLSYSLFLDEFMDYLGRLVTAPGYLLLTVDFNFHLDIPDDTMAQQSLNLIHSYNQAQKVSFASHVCGPTPD